MTYAHRIHTKAHIHTSTEAHMRVGKRTHTHITSTNVHVHTRIKLMQINTHPCACIHTNGSMSLRRRHALRFACPRLHPRRCGDCHRVGHSQQHAYTPTSPRASPLGFLAYAPGALPQQKCGRVKYAQVCCSLSKQGYHSVQGGTASQFFVLDAYYPA